VIHTDKKRLRADIILLLVALIWGSAFAAQRVAAEHLGFFLFNGSRFLVGGLTVYAIAAWRSTPFLRAFTRLELIGGILGSLCIFAGANLQQAGLQSTTAGKAGFITGLYVVLVPIFIALTAIWKRGRGEMGHVASLPWTVWIASACAAGGLYFLSAAESVSLNPGDLIVLAGTLFWALHIILIGWLANRTNTLRFAFLQYLFCGILNVILGSVFEAGTWGGLLPAWWTVAYVGIFSVGLAYTLQVEGQKMAPEADASIILSMEAVFAAIFGWLTLGEALTSLQLLGCSLIFAGMLLAQTPSFQRKESKAALSEEC
jgi:drug/metabolite transporter (DMT)-like permease